MLFICFNSIFIIINSNSIIESLPEVLWRSLEQMKNILFFASYVFCCVRIIAFTICPGSSGPFYKVTYYIKWFTTFWTHSIFVVLRLTKQTLNLFFSTMLFNKNSFSKFFWSIQNDSQSRSGSGYLILERIRIQDSKWNFENKSSLMSNQNLYYKNFIE